MIKGTVFMQLPPTCVYAPCATPSDTYNLAIFCVSFNVRGLDRTLKCTLGRTWVSATFRSFGKNYGMFWSGKTQKFAARPANWIDSTVAHGAYTVLLAVCRLFLSSTKELCFEVVVQVAMEKTMLHVWVWWIPGSQRKVAWSIYEMQCTMSLL